MRFFVPLLACGLLAAAGARAQTPVVESTSPGSIRIEAGERAKVVLQGRYLGSLEGAAVRQGRTVVSTIRATLAPAGKDLTRRGVVLEATGDAAPATGLELLVSYPNRFRSPVWVDTPARIEIVGLPDLRFAGCSLNTELVVSSDSGSKLVVNVVVQNDGTAPAIWPSTSRTGYVEAFRIRSPPEWDYAGLVPAGTVIEPGQRRRVRAEVPLVLLDSGEEYRVSGEIDAARLVEESDEADNRFDCATFSTG